MARPKSRRAGSGMRRGDGRYRGSTGRRTSRPERREQKTHLGVLAGRRCGCRRGDVDVEPAAALAPAGRGRAGAGASRARGRGRGRDGGEKATPVQIEALGTVTPIASVAIKTPHRQRDHRNPFRRRRAREAGRPPDHARQPRDRGADPAGRGQRRARQGAARKAPSATSTATPNWSRRAHTPITNLDNAKTQVRGLRSRPEGRRSACSKNLQCSAELCHDPRADLGPHQRRHREGRKLRALRRPAADRDHHPDRAGLRLVPDAAGQLPALRKAIAESRDASKRSFPATEARASAASR